MKKSHTSATIAMMMLAASAMLGTSACTNRFDDGHDDKPPTAPAGMGLVCIHSETSSELRDEIEDALERSGATLLVTCPGGAELDTPVVAAPMFDPYAAELTAAGAGRIVRSTEGGFEPVRVAVIRAMPSEPRAAELARQWPVIESLYYCEGHDCAPVQYEVYVLRGMNPEALISRVERAAGLDPGP